MTRPTCGSAITHAQIYALYAVALARSVSVSKADFIVRSQEFRVCREMKVALVCALCMSLLVAAAAEDDGEKPAKRHRKKNFKGRPNVVIFLVDDVSE